MSLPRVCVFNQTPSGTVRWTDELAASVCFIRTPSGTAVMEIVTQRIFGFSVSPPPPPWRDLALR